MNKRSQQRAKVRNRVPKNTKIITSLNNFPGKNDTAILSGIKNITPTCEFHFK